MNKKIEGEAVKEVGTDLATVLRSEADDLPMEVTEEETSMQQYSGVEEDPMKALLRESREHTKLLRMHTTCVTLLALIGGLGVGGFVILVAIYFKLG